MCACCLSRQRKGGRVREKLVVKDWGPCPEVGCGDDVGSAIVTLGVSFDVLNTTDVSQQALQAAAKTETAVHEQVNA